MALKEIQTILDQIQVLDHVTGYICMTANGVPVRTTFDEEYTKCLVTQLQPFLDRIKRTVHQIGFKDIVELRLKSKNVEYLLRTDHLCTFIVVQQHQKLRSRLDE